MENQDLKTNLEKLLMETHILKFVFAILLKGEYFQLKPRHMSDKGITIKEQKNEYISEYPSYLTKYYLVHEIFLHCSSYK